MLTYNPQVKFLAIMYQEADLEHQKPGLFLRACSPTRVAAEDCISVISLCPEIRIPEAAPNRDANPKLSGKNRVWKNADSSSKSFKSELLV